MKYVLGFEKIKLNRCLDAVHKSNEWECFEIKVENPIFVLPSWLFH